MSSVISWKVEVFPSKTFNLLKYTIIKLSLLLKVRYPSYSFERILECRINSHGKINQSITSFTIIQTQVLTWETINLKSGFRFLFLEAKLSRKDTRDEGFIGNRHPYKRIRGGENMIFAETDSTLSPKSPLISIPPSSDSQRIWRGRLIPNRHTLDSRFKKNSRQNPWLQWKTKEGRWLEESRITWTSFSRFRLSPVLFDSSKNSIFELDIAGTRIHTTLQTNFQQNGGRSRGGGSWLSFMIRVCGFII